MVVVVVVVVEKLFCHVPCMYVRTDGTSKNKIYTVRARDVAS